VVLGMTRHEWGDLHLYVALLFITTIVLHLVMNWTWLMKIASFRRGWPVWSGLAAGAAIVLLLILAPVQ
jgi:hypothetical protein